MPIAGTNKPSAATFGSVASGAQAGAGSTMRDEVDPLGGAWWGCYVTALPQVERRGARNAGAALAQLLQRGGVRAAGAATIAGRDASGSEARQRGITQRGHDAEERGNGDRLGEKGGEVAAVRDRPVAAGTGHDDRNRIRGGVGREGLAERDAVHHRHHQVGNDHAGRAAATAVSAALPCAAVSTT